MKLFVFPRNDASMERSQHFNLDQVTYICFSSEKTTEKENETHRECVNV